MSNQNTCADKDIPFSAVLGYLGIGLVVGFATWLIWSWWNLRKDDEKLTWNNLFPKHDYNNDSGLFLFFSIVVSALLWPITAPLGSGALLILAALRAILKDKPEEEEKQQKKVNPRASYRSSGFEK